MFSIVVFKNTFFVFSLIIQGATEKVLQFILQVKSIYNKTLFSANKLYFLTLQRDSNKKKVYKLTLFLP
jgi:hypothetical protein